MITPRPYQRRWRLPTPYVRDAEPLEAAGVLDEVSGPLGLLLWQSVRDAALWAMTPAEAREGLFHPDAEPRRLADLLTIGPAAARIEEPLGALARMLTHPADTAPEVVMLACDRISQWAEAGDRVATALTFAQAAALAVPASARGALRVGRLARRRGELVRAEGWLQRAVVLARQEGDRVSHAWGYTALGSLHMLRGNLPSAERHHQRALRIAERHSLRARAAAALHDLFVVSADRGRTGEAVGYARRAVEMYGPKHQKLPVLAHDVALMWLEQGEFSHALPVLEAVCPFVPTSQSILGLASTARAAGGLGRRALFDDYHRRVVALADRDSQRDNQPAALLNVARGAAHLGERELAESLGHRCLELARELQQHKIVFAAESLLDSLHADTSAAGTPLEAPADAKFTDEEADSLVGELVACFA